jgi:transcriptional regulator with XRE-family HTH domain
MNPTQKELVEIKPYDVKIHHDEKTSQMHISAHWFKITVNIKNRFSVRNRRQFLLSINAALLPKLDFLHFSYIHHLEHIPPNVFLEKFPDQLSNKQAIYLDDDQAKLRYWIRGCRTRAGLTQIKFAKLLGISNGHLSKIEKGQKPISRVLANKIMESIKVLEEEIYYLKDQPVQPEKDERITHDPETLAAFARLVNRLKVTE